MIRKTLETRAKAGTYWAVRSIAKSAHGGIIAQCKRIHRPQECLEFLNRTKPQVPPVLEMHAIVDNYETHSHKAGKNWLARHSRWHIHHIPTYASWPNQVEIWFSLIIHQAIRRGTFRSVKEVVGKIRLYTENYDRDAHPNRWIATAASIFSNIQKLSQSFSVAWHQTLT